MSSMVDKINPNSYEVPEILVPTLVTSPLPSIGMKQADSRIGNYAVFVKVYSDFYSRNGGQSDSEDDEDDHFENEIQLVSPQELCSNLARELQIPGYRIDMIRTLLRWTIKDCLEAASNIHRIDDTARLPSLDWMADYRNDSPSYGDLFLGDDAVIDQAVRDARKYIKTVKTNDEVGKECALVVRFLERTHRTYDVAKREKTEWTDQQLDAFYKALDANVEGDEALQDFLIAMQSDIIDDHSIPGKFYCRGLAFFQSSGCGKSRLARSAGLCIPSFQVVLEKPDCSDQSVPRPDSTVCQFFKEKSESELGHEIAAAFLSAFFHQLYIKIAIHYLGGTHLSLPFTCGYDNYNDAKTSKEWARACMVGQNVKRCLSQGILRPLHSLRPQSRTRDRDEFIEGVIGLAEEILWRMSDLRRKGFTSAVPTDEEYRYIGLSELDTNIVDFFHLIDGTSHGPKRNLFNKTEYHQFIFGLDNCCMLDSLLEDKVGKYSRSQGLASFVRVFHDLHCLAVKAKKGINHATRRVWLAMLDTNITARRIVPWSDKDKESLRYIVPGTPEGKKIEKHNRIFQGGYTVATVWNHFGMDHALRLAKKSGEKLFDDMTMKQMHDFRHLKLMGRGLWDSYTDHTALMGAAIKLILADQIHSWDSNPLFDEGQTRGDAKKIDEIVFTIASLRFNLDNGLLEDATGKTTQIMTELTAKHMRILFVYKNEYTIETETPSEPLLAAAAMYLLNFGRSLLKPYCHSVIAASYGEYYSEFHWNGKRNMISWKNMLLEMSRYFGGMSNLINIGSFGEVVGRMILTPARDCTLPEVWNAYTNAVIPCTTVKRYLDELVGKDKAKAIIAKANNPAFAQSLINFTHFIPIYTPVRSQKRFLKMKGYPKLEESQLSFGFKRCGAYVCLPNQNGTSAFLPIAVPKKPMDHLDDDKYLAYVEETKLQDYTWDYIGIQIEAGQTPHDTSLTSDPIYKDGNVVKEQPIAIILMDMVVEVADDKNSFDAGPARIADHISAELVNAQNQYGDPIPEAEPVLEIRIRDLNGAYPCLADLDPEGTFQKSVYSTLTRRHREYLQ